MPASKAEQVLEALRGVLDLVPGAVVQRNSVLPEKVPATGLIILRDGDPGEPEQALGGFGSTYYQHTVEIEIEISSRTAMRRHGTPPSTRSSSRSVRPSKPTRPSAASRSA
jgi:hypothetical protein